LRRLGLGVLLALVAASPALAKGGSAFDRPSAHPGESVSVGVSAIIGERWPARTAVEVYLLPLTASPRWWTTYNSYGPTYGPRPRLAGAVRLGRIWHRVTSEAPRLRIHVPKVAPGRYVLGYWVAAIQARWTSALPNYQIGSNAVIRVRR
jgi:hypothetical protein